MWQYRYTDELYHAGVKGMKWGRRKARPIFSGLRSRVRGMKKTLSAKTPAEKQARKEKAKKTVKKGAKIAAAVVAASAAVSAAKFIANRNKMMRFING